MAEFSEVMRQYKRLHDYYLKDNSSGAYTGFSCEGCPIKEWQNKHETSLICFYHSGAQAYYPIISNMGKVERIVMSWAAEHPEPAYPTWGTWLAEKYGFDLREIMYTPIPADIAQKLELQPKENT